MDGQTSFLSNVPLWCEFEDVSAESLCLPTSLQYHRKETICETRSEDSTKQRTIAKYPTRPRSNSAYPSTTSKTTSQKYPASEITLNRTSQSGRNSVIIQLFTINKAGDIWLIRKIQASNPLLVNELGCLLIRCFSHSDGLIVTYKRSCLANGAEKPSIWAHAFRRQSR